MTIIFQESYESLVENYERVVNRWFIGRYLGIRPGDNTKGDFAVFKIDKYQPTNKAKKFLRKMYKLNEFNNVSIVDEPYIFFWKSWETLDPKLFTFSMN